MYTIIFLGNGIILHIVRFDPALHQPMYFFLAMLAFVELGVFVSGPTVLGIFLFGINNISFGGCLLQMFSRHSFFFLTLQYCIGFSKYQNESATGIHVFPILNPPPSP